jgi:hypothetical protein
MPDLIDRHALLADVTGDAAATRAVYEVEQLLRLLDSVLTWAGRRRPPGAGSPVAGERHEAAIAADPGEELLAAERLERRTDACALRLAGQASVDFERGQLAAAGILCGRQQPQDALAEQKFCRFATRGVALFTGRELLIDKI